MKDTEEYLQQALSKAYFFLKFRPRSEKEMMEYFGKKARRFKWSQETIDRAIATLKEYSYIDDKAFVDWYVSSSLKLKIKSEKLIKNELIHKFGINKFLIEDFFAFNKVSDIESAIKLLSRRWSRLKKYDKKDRFKKSAEFLSRRGFSYDAIKKAFEELEKTL